MRLLANLALQNLGRRKARSLLLIAAVAVGSGVVFTGATLMRSIDDSMAVGFTRLGADMMVGARGRAHQHHGGAADGRADRSRARRR